MMMMIMMSIHGHYTFNILIAFVLSFFHVAVVVISGWPFAIPILNCFVCKKKIVIVVRKSLSN